MSDAHGPQRLSDEPGHGIPAAKPTVITPTSTFAGSLAVGRRVTHRATDGDPVRAVAATRKVDLFAADRVSDEYRRADLARRARHEPASL